MGVEERFKKKLAIWKRQYVSKGGRPTLLRSTLSNLLIYIMSLFRLPKGVKARLEKIQKDFLWGGDNLEKKIHLVNWNTVCTGREKEGLGLRNLFIVNRALLRKWIWRFAKDESFILKDVIRLKYQVEKGGWFTKAPRGSGGVGLWKDISKENRLVKLDSYFVLGDGSRISFWEDCWCEEGAFCEIFPTLYRLVETLGESVADVSDNTRGLGAWDLNFVRPLNDWEVDDARRFLCLLTSKRLKHEEKDSLLWKGDKKGVYTVRANAALLEGDNGRTTPLDMLWNNYMPLEVCFFAWEVWWGKVLIAENLKKRGF